MSPMDEQRNQQQLRTELVKLAVEKFGAKTPKAALRIARSLEGYVGERVVAPVERHFGMHHARG